MPSAEPVQVQSPRVRARVGQPVLADRRRLRRQLVTMGVIATCVITVLLAVPALRPVLREIADMNPALLAAAVALEFASCLSFVILFRLLFASVPATASRQLAWSQMGSGALLPGAASARSPSAGGCSI
jgi:Fe2+ transport system protein FeoA